VGGGKAKTGTEHASGGKATLAGLEG
jgi:hypothetical protein